MSSNNCDLDELQNGAGDILRRLENPADPTSVNDISVFSRLYSQLLNEPSTIDWSAIEPVDAHIYHDYNSLFDGHPNLNTLAVIKLNGGLGTSMGCNRPKSLVPVRNDVTFLQMAVEQIRKVNQVHSSSVPLILMNSFNTAQQTEIALRLHGRPSFVRTFTQNRCPRLFKDSLLPVPTSANDRLVDGWCPPGHGNLFESLYNCGLLDQLIAEGRQYCFVSNIDNTGASVDVAILQFLLDHRPDYLMEVTAKTSADVKGGTLIKINGKLMHLELPQVPKEHVEEFQSDRFEIFNTNNIWVNLKAVRQLVKTGRMKMELITTIHGEEILQLETSIGGAIRNFDNAICLNVPRRRFLPVKKTQDMLAIMSDLYSLKDGQLVANSRRKIAQMPLIKLSPYFETIVNFNKRIAAIPSIVNLVHLTVIGDVYFGKNVQLKGTVVIIADGGCPLEIPEGTVIDNKIVTGTLRMFEH